MALKVWSSAGEVVFVNLMAYAIKSIPLSMALKQLFTRIN